MEQGPEILQAPFANCHDFSMSNATPLPRAEFEKLERSIYRYVPEFSLLEWNPYLGDVEEPKPLYYDDKF